MTFVNEISKKFNCSLDFFKIIWTIGWGMKLFKKTLKTANRRKKEKDFRQALNNNIFRRSTKSKSLPKRTEIWKIQGGRWDKKNWASSRARRKCRRVYKGKKESERKRQDIKRKRIVGKVYDDSGWQLARTIEMAKGWWVFSEKKEGPYRCGALFGEVQLGEVGTGIH